MTNSRVFKAVLFSFLFTVFGSSIAKTIEIQDSSILAPSSMDKVALFHDEDGFRVSQNNEMHSVEKCWVDSSLQNISRENLKKFLAAGYIRVNQMDSGEFSLQARNLIKGGGLGGAAVGFWIGRALVYGSVAVVGAVATVVAAPVVGLVAAGAAVTATVAFYAPVIATAAESAGLAGGIIGGVATGPG